MAVTVRDDKLAALADLLNEQRNAGLVGFSDDALALRFTEKLGGTLAMSRSGTGGIAGWVRTGSRSAPC